MPLLYSIFVYLYTFGIKVAALFTVKAKLWVTGRKHQFRKLSDFFNNNHKKVVWFHAASLGEFEQGSPLIEAYKRQYPEQLILLTFFSPSGYEVKKNYKHADYICYLPADTPANAAKFFDIVKPDKVFFIKYEFWFNYMLEAEHRNIDWFVVSAIFRPSQLFFKSYGRWFLQRLKHVKHFFTQNEKTTSLLYSYGINDVTETGDTRFDRVIDVLKNKKSFPEIERFVNGKSVFVAGSSWLPDEKLLSEIMEVFPEMQWIIVPHEIHENHLEQLESLLLLPHVRYSHADEEHLRRAKILIIDQIGMLSQIYQYAHFAYIGGGFGKGIHNILEAAVYGIPVFFGPNYLRFNEAVELVNMGGAYSIHSGTELHSLLKQFTEDKIIYNHTAQVCKNYVEVNIGASQKIMHYLEQFNA